MAVVAADAGHQAAHHRAGVERQFLQQRLLREGADAVFGDIRDKEILLHRETDLPVAVALGQVGGAAHLGRGDAADRHEQAGVEQVRPLAAGPRLLRVDAEVVGMRRLADFGAGAVQRPAPAPLQLAAEPAEAEVLDQKRQPGLVTTFAGAVVAEDADDVAAQSGASSGRTNTSRA